MCLFCRSASAHNSLPEQPRAHPLALVLMLAVVVHCGSPQGGARSDPAGQGSSEGAGGQRWREGAKEERLGFPGLL